MSRARTLNGANQFEVDELNIIGDGLAINDNFGLQNQILGKDVNNELVYKDLDISAFAGLGLKYITSSNDINIDFNSLNDGDFEISTGLS